MAQHGPHDAVVAVGSQGSLHFLNALLDGGGRAVGSDEASLGGPPRSRIQTGHFCTLVYESEGTAGGGHWHVASWNTDPADVVPPACP